MPHEDNRQQNDFLPGRILATPGALEAIRDSGQSPAEFLSRHLQHDWGCVSESDRRLNNAALGDGSRILSAYETSQGIRLWIITDAADNAGNRLSTTILLPQEY
jgi:hypothetical protein